MCSLLNQYHYIFIHDVDGSLLDKFLNKDLKAFCVKLLHANHANIRSFTRLFLQFYNHYCIQVLSNPNQTLFSQKLSEDKMSKLESRFCSNSTVAGNNSLQSNANTVGNQQSGSIASKPRATGYNPAGPRNSSTPGQATTSSPSRTSNRPVSSSNTSSQQNQELLNNYVEFPGLLKFFFYFIKYANNCLFSTHLMDIALQELELLINSNKFAGATPFHPTSKGNSAGNNGNSGGFGLDSFQSDVGAINDSDKQLYLIIRLQKLGQLVALLHFMDSSVALPLFPVNNSNGMVNNTSPIGGASHTPLSPFTYQRTIPFKSILENNNYVESRCLNLIWIVSFLKMIKFSHSIWNSASNSSSNPLNQKSVIRDELYPTDKTVPELVEFRHFQMLYFHQFQDILKVLYFVQHPDLSKFEKELSSTK
jgi:hypothetical protein